MSSVDPTLTNSDLRPTTPAQRTWTTYSYIALWFSMSMEITTYQLASSLIAKGMDWKQAVGTVLLGNLIVLVALIGLAVKPLHFLYDYSWFVGFFTAGAIYVGLMRGTDSDLIASANLEPAANSADSN